MESIEVQVERLQGGWPPRTSEDREPNAPLQDSACLGVQLHLMLSLRVLDAGNVGLEGFPYHPHLLGVQQRHPCSPSEARRSSWMVVSTPRVCLRQWMSFMVVSTPRVCRRQWRASSFLLMWCRASLSEGVLMLTVSISGRLAAIRASRSSLLYSNIHWDGRPRKSWWASVVHPTVKRRMKCQMSRRNMVSGRALNILRGPLFGAAVPEREQALQKPGFKAPTVWYNPWSWSCWFLLKAPAVRWRALI